MTCSSCPFSLLPEAEMALNLGCLPEPYEIMKIKRETGKNWSCHRDETMICVGFVEHCREQGVDYKSGGLASYEKWYRIGEP